jgi:MoaA/NifB/PqqE/SkfB family radical SAM enzyme
MAKKIAASRLKVLAVSLDAIDAKIHDTIRGKDGAFDHAIKALTYLNKYRSKELNLVILPLILEGNLETLPDLVRWVKESKQADSVSLLALVESGLINQKEGWFKKPEYKLIWPQNSEKTKKVMETLIDMKQHGYPISNPYNQLEAFKEYYRDPEKFLNETAYCIRDYIIDFDPNGDILLSGHKLGSIKESIPLKRLWFSEKANEIRKYIDEHGCVNSRSCLINFICAFLKKEEHEVIYCAKKAYAYQQSGKYDYALIEFKKAFALSPRDGKLLLGTAYNYFQLNDYEAALKEYEEAFRISPETRTAEVNLQYMRIQKLKLEKDAGCQSQ